MSDRDPVGTEKERALWERLKASVPAGSAAQLAPVFDEELAAWLDGRLSAEASARVEARLAADPAALDLALDAACALREASGATSGRLVTRAQALVGFDAERQVRSGGGVRAWLAGWRRQFEMAMVAGAFAIVCVTGFSLGGAFQAAYAEETFDVADFVVGPLGDSEIGFFVDQGDPK
jgi:anti-sigma factor RsiW